LENILTVTDNLVMLIILIRVLCNVNVTSRRVLLTASSTCGPDQHGNLPNGAPIAKPGSDIATANSIIQIMEAGK